MKFREGTPSSWMAGRCWLGSGVTIPHGFRHSSRHRYRFASLTRRSETFAVAPIVQCRPDGTVERFRFSNQLMQTIDPSRPGTATFYRAYHELCRRLTNSAAQARFRLDAGEILVVASHRVLHGRTAFEPTGKRHLQDAYYELDNVRNHRVVLLRKKRRSREHEGLLHRNGARHRRGLRARVRA